MVESGQRKGERSMRTDYVARDYWRRYPCFLEGHDHR